MDKILLQNMAFYGYHGVMPEENVLGQKFFIDVELHLNLQQPGRSDRVEDTVNYAHVYEQIKEIVEKQKFQLIEALGETIAQNILEKQTLVQEVLVRVKKPEAPIPGIFDYVAIEVNRKR
ncbi:dihydroneopterin aldolase [Bacillota bacterium LX-D]|nr:dihydroneopterin aldolase [Bacillota bacterium LX-D]